jgi:16S rRNA (guanine966-N2)-methyltransferase
LADKALASLAGGGWLKPKALIVAETAADEGLEAPGFAALDERDHGETRLRFLTPGGA